EQDCYPQLFPDVAEEDVHEAGVVVGRLEVNARVLLGELIQNFVHGGHHVVGAGARVLDHRDLDGGDHLTRCPFVVVQEVVSAPPLPIRIDDAGHVPHVDHTGMVLEVGTGGASGEGGYPLGGRRGRGGAAPHAAAAHAATAAAAGRALTPGP